MKKYFSCLCFCLFFSSAVFANNQLPLNTMSFRLQAEAWATTNTAKVIVSVDAAADAISLSHVQSRILEKLASLSKVGSWHITSFRRTQDNSGLEHIYAIAEARLPQSALSQLRKLAKKISRPGETYKVVGIQFNPSQKELQAVKLSLHQVIYKMANQELQKLNSAYPNQHYTVHKVTFETAPQPRTPRLMNTYMAAKSVEKASGDLGLVSHQVIVSANIELAEKIQ